MWSWSSPMDVEETDGAALEGGKERLHELVFVQLMHEVEHGAPGARLSARLRAALERMAPGERRAVAARLGPAGGAPLFVAARRGNAEVVEYLVHVCGAPLEQRGAYSSPAERAAHSVTPLWAAAVAGRAAALRVLADAGAALDARSDTGSTPLRSACFMTHLDAVRFLCERGADVHARNHNGGTCLINGVQCARLTRYLLAQGARVDAQDAHGKTALHYAIQEHRAETARVLLAAGASPHVRALGGDDALRTACLRGAPQLVELLLAAAREPPERRADAYELLGATQLDEFNDAAAALAAWRRATAVREAGGAPLPKRPAAGPCAALGGAREWAGGAQLEAAAAEADELRTQALLVAVRVLGAAHKDTVFRLMYRGAWYADGGRWQRCLDLWTWALELRIERDTLLHTDTCHTVCALTRLLVDLCFSSDRPEGEEEGEGESARGQEPSFDVIMRVLRLVARAVPEGQRLISLSPWCEAQAEAWERALRCLVHLAVVAERAAGRARRSELVRELTVLVSAGARTRGSGSSLLQLACSRLTSVRSAYLAELPRPRALFPSLRAARLLLAAGASAAARDRAGRSALHVAATPYNASAELLEVLVLGGAHVCSPDARGASALALAPGSLRAALHRHVTLACLAAAALLRAPAPPPARVLPRTLRPFLDLHRYP